MMTSLHNLFLLMRAGLLSSILAKKPSNNSGKNFYSNMKVLVDYIGHADLYYSMHALFEKRLGWTLYRPDGSEEWKQNRIWTSTPTPDVKIVQSYNDVQRAYCSIHRYHQNLISFQQFLDSDINIIVTTVHSNENAFYNLWQNYKPQSAYIRHIANIKEKPKECKNILLSTTEPMPKTVNWISYLPEHLDDYCPGELNLNKKIKSFSNYLPNYPQDIKTWRHFQSKLSEYSFWMHGGKTEHRTVPQAQLPDAMRDAMFIWHTKAHGGCGYTARQALACGKPLIVKKQYAKTYNTLAKEYLVDGVNCIDLSCRPDVESIKLIRQWSEPDKYEEICNAVIAKNQEFMNFEQEAENIKVWIENLL